MKMPLEEEIKIRRRSHLSREDELYETEPHGSYIKLKDWDDVSPIVIWGGVIEHPDLQNSYTIKIQYPVAYPDRRPQIYPVKPRIVNQRHQLPNSTDPKAPGSLCYMPLTPDYWHSGLTCHDVIQRAVKWFRHYEDGTLGDEFAPPEIEIYYPHSNRSTDCEVLAIDTLVLGDDRRTGSFLLIPTGFEKFAFISTTDYSRSTDDTIEELRRLRNLILPGDWFEMEQITNGRWFKLKREPDMPVPVNAAMLLDLLSRSGFSENDINMLAKLDPRSVALCYPTDADRLHWLLYETTFSFPSNVGFRKESFKMKLRESNKSKPIKLRKLSQIDRETLFRRVSGFEVEDLLHKKCLVLGAGSVGSTIADELVKSGVGSLTIIDNDTLESGNVCRHRLGLNYVGRGKAESLKIELLRRNPFAEIRAISQDVVVNLDTLSSEIEKADLVISCLGNDPAELFVDRVRRRSGTPALFCRSYLEGRFGEIIVIPPGNHGPCLSCVATQLGSPENAIPRPPEIPYQDLVRFDGGCGTVFIPASSVDLGFTALHSVKIVIDCMQNADRVGNNYFIVRGREFADGEVMELVGDIREPYRLHSYRIQPADGCYH